MSRQVKTPRFYCDIPTFLQSVGDLRWDTDRGGLDLLFINPSNPYTRATENEAVGLFKIGSRDIEPKHRFPINFCALLNHNLASNSNPFYCLGFDEGGNQNILVPTTEILNASINPQDNSSLTEPTWNGTSIFSFTEIGNRWQDFHIYYGGPDNLFADAALHQLGSFVVGKYWDAPYGPDLKLTMSRRFPGIKKQTSVGGKTFANRYYDGPAEWTMNHRGEGIYDGVYQYPPFELDYAPSIAVGDLYDIYRAKSGVGRKGLRSWSLTFSYMSEDDMWMAYESSSVAPFGDSETYSSITNSDVPTDNGTTVANFEHSTPTLFDDSFNYVWNVTLGGALPFIFQPDKDNNNPDQFAICTFKENSLKVTQVAHNTYSISVTIDELG